MSIKQMFNNFNLDYDQEIKRLQEESSNIKLNIITRIPYGISSYGTRIGVNDSYAVGWNSVGVVSHAEGVNSTTQALNFSGSHIAQTGNSSSLNQPENNIQNVIEKEFIPEQKRLTKIMED